MGMRPRSQAELDDFPGLMTRPDPNDIPDGAAEVQTNLSSHAPGMLVTRPGYKQVQFDAEEGQ